MYFVSIICDMGENKFIISI